jgi:hypothetical protein
MSIIDSQLVNIEIYTFASDDRPQRLCQRQSGLRLNYQAQNYNLVQVFAIHKLERAEQKLQKLLVSQSYESNKSVSRSTTDRYLMVREVGYYSLWVIDATPNKPDLNQQYDREILELRQASIWLFQELWLQWQDLVGAKQLRVFAEHLLTVTPQLQSLADIDRLLIIDPRDTAKLGSWAKLDSIAFTQEVYRLTQQKIGQQLGEKLTIDIMQSMPDSLGSRLTDILDI